MTRNDLSWVDYCKGTAILWIFLNHVSEQVLGYPLIANPSKTGPVFRAAWATPLAGWSRPLEPGLESAPLRGLVRRPGGRPVPDLERIRPDVGSSRARGQRAVCDGTVLQASCGAWSIHCGGGSSLLHGNLAPRGYGLSLADPRTYLSLLGVRMTPGLFFYFTPAWWYIGLLIQLYLVYPLLWKALHRRGPLWMLAVACIVAFAVRFIGLVSFEGFVGQWSLGAVFITRLPEFVLGIFLAARLHADPAGVDARLRSHRSSLTAAAVFAAGIGLSLTLAGMTVAPFLMAGGVLVVLYGCSSPTEGRTAPSGGPSPGRVDTPTRSTWPPSGGPEATARGHAARSHRMGADPGGSRGIRGPGLGIGEAVRFRRSAGSGWWTRGGPPGRSPVS